MLLSLQYLRAFAALAVVLFHFRPLFLSAGGPPAIAAAFDWGHAGVPIFFVLAGFIMVWTTRLSTPAVPFLARRLLRIYGGYLPLAFLFLVYKHYTTGIAHWVPGGLNLWGSLSLTEADSKRLLIYPAWTLPYELLFYLLFATCLIRGPRWFLAKFSIAAGALAWLGLSGILAPSIASVLANPINLCFLLGVGAGLAAIQPHQPGLKVVAAMIGCGLIFGGVFQQNSDDLVVRITAFGIGTALLVLGIAQIEYQWRIPKIKFLEKLGDASYAIYLIHVPILFIAQTTPLAETLAWNIGAFGLSAVYIVAVVAFSLTYYSFIEAPINLWGKRRFSRPRLSLKEA